MRKIVVLLALLSGQSALAAVPEHCYGDQIARVSSGYVDLVSKGRFYRVTRGNTRGWRIGDDVILCAHSIENKRMRRTVWIK